MFKYQVQNYAQLIDREFDTREEAVAFLERIGEGQLIKWRVDRNIPYAKPDFVYRSCSLDVLENGAWRSCNIHG